MVRTIVGANWGDEGKGKVTDLLAEESDVVVRFQGGANAGHTIINEYGKFALHLLPSGVFHQNVVNVIGPGVALNIEALLSELESLTSRGVPMPKLMISDRCQVMMPYHIAFDKLEEERLGKSAFGSTKSGIAPFYSDKYAKVGIQVCQLYDEELLRKRLEIALVKKNVLLEHLYHQPPIDVNELVPYLQGLAEKIRPMVADTTHFLYQANKEGKTILLEGQLGSLRDPDHGIYPYTTSSSPLAGYGCVGAGVSPRDMTDIVCVTKAYSSCVGAGAFVSKLDGAAGDELRRRGGDAGEFGATTGRARDVGWFDAVATRYGVMVQGATQVVSTYSRACSARRFVKKAPAVFPRGLGFQVAAQTFSLRNFWIASAAASSSSPSTLMVTVSPCLTPMPIRAISLRISQLLPSFSRVAVLAKPFTVLTSRPAGRAWMPQASLIVY